MEPMAVRCMIACNAIDYVGVDNPSVICFANATSRDRFPSGSDQYTKGGIGGSAAPMVRRRDGKPVPYDGKPAGYGIMTWFCVSKIFGPVGPEKRSYAIDPYGGAIM